VYGTNLFRQGDYRVQQPKVFLPNAMQSNKNLNTDYGWAFDSAVNTGMSIKLSSKNFRRRT